MGCLTCAGVPMLAFAFALALALGLLLFPAPLPTPCPSLTSDANLMRVKDGFVNPLVLRLLPIVNAAVLVALNTFEFALAFAFAFSLSFPGVDTGIDAVVDASGDVKLDLASMKVSASEGFLALVFALALVGVLALFLPALALALTLPLLVRRRFAADP